MAKRPTFKAAFKAQTAKEALRGDKTVPPIAVKHGVNPNPVSQWKLKASEGLVLLFERGAPAGRDDPPAAPEDRAGRPRGEPVRSLYYVAGPLEEVGTESFPASWWRHLEFNLRCARLRGNGPVEGAGFARPDLAQAASSARTPNSLSGAYEGDKRETGQ